MQNTESSQGQETVECLVAILRFNGVAVDRESLKQEFGERPPSFDDVVRCARRHGLKARATKTTIARPEQTPMPAVAWDQAGGIFLVLKAADNRVPIQKGFPGRPEIIGKANLQNAWNGRLVLMTKRGRSPTLGVASISSGSFMRNTYRWTHGQMLVASFFLQILALVPLPVPFSLDQTSNARDSNGAHPGPIVKSGESEGSKMNETISLQEMVALPLFVAAAISFAPYLVMAYKKKRLLVLPSPLEISRASLVTAPLGCYFWGLASMFLVNSYNPLFYSPAAILTPAIYAFPAIAYSFLSGLVGHIFFILITPDINLCCWALTSTVTLCVTLSFSIMLSPIFEVYVLSRL